MSVDGRRLVAWLVERAKHRDPVLGAVYQGLADRVRRGEFDEGEEGTDGVVQGR